MIRSAEVGSRIMPRPISRKLMISRKTSGLSVRPEQALGDGLRHLLLCEDPAEQSGRPDDDHDLGGHDRRVAEDQDHVAPRDRPVAEGEREHVQRPDPGGLGRREEPAEDAAQDEHGRTHRAAGLGRRRVGRRPVVGLALELRLAAWPRRRP